MGKEKTSGHPCFSDRVSPFPAAKGGVNSDDNKGLL
jgi:hypothetical protein